MTIVYPPPGKWREETHLELSQRHGATTWALVPTQLWRILDHPDLDRYDTSSVRNVGGGSAVWPPELLRTLAERIPTARRRAPRSATAAPRPPAWARRLRPGPAAGARRQHRHRVGDDAGAGPRPRDRQGAARGRGRRDLPPRRLVLPRLLAQPGGDGRGARRRPLVPHRRLRRDPRRLRAPRGSSPGPHHPRRREHLTDRDREPPVRAPRGRRGGDHRRRPPHARAGGRRVRGAAHRRRDHRGRRASSGSPRRSQGSRCRAGSSSATTLPAQRERQGAQARARVAGSQRAASSKTTSCIVGIDVRRADGARARRSARRARARRRARRRARGAYVDDGAVLRAPAQRTRAAPATRPRTRSCSRSPTPRAPATGWRLDDCALVVDARAVPDVRGRGAGRRASRSWCSVPPTRRRARSAASTTSVPIPGSITASRCATACGRRSRRRCSRSSSRAAAYNDRGSEGCESGRIGWSRKPLWRKSPWVQIPVPPPSEQRGQDIVVLALVAVIARERGTSVTSSCIGYEPRHGRHRARSDVPLIQDAGSAGFAPRRPALVEGAAGRPFGIRVVDRHVPGDDRGRRRARAGSSCTSWVQSVRSTTEWRAGSLVTRRRPGTT